MNKTLLYIAALGLSACTTGAPYESGGVGFTDYQSYMRQREAALNGNRPETPGGETGFSTDRIGSAIDAATGLPVQPVPPPDQTGGGVGAVIGSAAPVQPASDPNDPNRARGDAPMGIASVSGEVNPNNSGISDEQDFNAVASRETIESDAQRLARNRAQYEVIQPGALPQRSGNAGANVVEFAMSTSHAPGTAVYKRSAIGLANPDRACSRYPSADLAQQAFLEAGGPDRDRRGLDPDGDGYACSWDPRPFRAN
jgi:hypothetical protein